MFGVGRGVLSLLNVSQETVPSLNVSELSLCNLLFALSQRLVEVGL